MCVRACVCDAFAAQLQGGEGLLKASSRALLDGTGLTAACAMDDLTKHICEASPPLPSPLQSTPHVTCIHSSLLPPPLRTLPSATHDDTHHPPPCCSADSNPFNQKSTEQILGVIVDMANPANASVHPGDKYALEGDETVVIRSRISELSQSLDVLASNGRVIDTRIVAFALGSELG